MTIFTPAITFREWVTAYLLRGKRHYDSAELENLSDRSLEDIGLEVRKRDFGTLKASGYPKGVLTVAHSPGGWCGRTKARSGPRRQSRQA
jgi:uncharacterized protein YjiS (DUF1127 family)